MKTCIVYGSETGSTEIASYTTYLYLHRHCIPIEIHLANRVDLAFLALFDHLVFFVPTAAFGEFPHNFEPLVNLLLDLQAEARPLSVKYTIFGLGDSRYPLYNFAARRLQSLLTSLQAHEFFPLALGDDQHHLGFDGELIVWREALLAFLKGLKPDAQTYSFQDSVFPYAVETVEQTTPELQSTLGSSHSKLDSSYISGTVSCNKIISSESHFTNVRAIAFETEAPCYSTGDVMCLFPTDDDVEQLLKVLNLDPGLVVRISRNTRANIQTVLSTHNESSSYWLELVRRRLSSLGLSASALPLLNGLKSGIRRDSFLSSRRLPIACTLTLSELFSKYLCLRNPCTPAQMYVMSLYAGEKLHADKLLEMAGDTLEGCVEYYRYCRSERRSFYDVLYDFPSVHLPLEVLVNICSPYYSRLYSIASSELDFVNRYAYTLLSHPSSLNYRTLKGFLDCNYSRTSRAELCVADVNYKTPCKRSVDGIASRFLSNLALGDRVDFLIYRPSFSSILLDTSLPVLFICTGTGLTVARPYMEFRAFKFKEVWRRHRLLPRARDMAFLGFRRPNQDHLYTDFEVVRHFCDIVFVHSRTRTTKFYVQDAIRQRADQVYPLLRDGIVLIGGKSHPMPAQVLEALASVLQTEAGFGPESAQRFIDDSIKQRKILIDTWG